MCNGAPEKVVAPREELGGPARGAVFADDEQAPNSSAAAKHATNAESDRPTVRAMLPPQACQCWLSGYTAPETGTVLPSQYRRTQHQSNSRLIGELHNMCVAGTEPLAP